MTKPFSSKSPKKISGRLRHLGFIILVGMYLSCSDKETVFNPCLQNFQLEDFKPSLHSIDWVPYIDKQVIAFSNESGEIIKLTKRSNQVLTESLRSRIIIPCPADSTQTSSIYYTTFEYQNRFDVISGNSNLTAIEINVDVLLDEKTSNLDDVQLADVLKIIFHYKNEIPYLVLQFPILDRGYKSALENTYQFQTTLNLRNKTFSRVYFNYENNEELKAYYSESGLLGFEINNELFVVK